MIFFGHRVYSCSMHRCKQNKARALDQDEQAMDQDECWVVVVCATLETRAFKTLTTILLTTPFVHEKYDTL